MSESLVSARKAICVSIAVLFLSAGCSSGGGDSSDDFAGTFDATGSWEGNWKLASVGESGSFSVKVSQASGTLSGTITISQAGLSDAPLTGKVSGNDVTFGDISGIVSFSGEADIFDNASGTFTVKESGKTYKGTWTAVCVRELVLQKTVTLPSDLSSSSYHGLAWDGTGFWVADGQRLAKVDTAGSLVASYMYNDDPVPYHDFDSLCWDGTSLYAIEDGLQEDYTKAMFFKIDRSTGEPTNPLPCPPDGTSSDSSPFGLGLAWDGSTLYCLRYSGYESSVIYKTNRATGASLGTVPVPVPTDDEGGSLMPGGFGAAGSDLYIANRAGIPIFKIRASDGKILRRFTYSGWSGYSGGSPGSVTWDGALLWVRDTMNGELLGFTMPTGLVQ